MARTLNYDVLLHIAEFLEAEEDYETLFKCSLANKAMNLVISKVLYRRVILSPPLATTFQLGRQDQELTAAWKSACLPRNAAHVLDVQVTGYLVPRASPHNNFGDVLCDSVRKWENLQGVIFAPRRCHPDVFIKALSTLKDCQHLRHLTINCLYSGGGSPLIQIEGLTSLTLLNPTRAIINDLPELLSRLSPSLKDFRLMDNCGSITPGVLKACLPHASKIRTFALGLSYSVTNDDIFSFLDQMESLCSLDLRYYLQLRVPSVHPQLPLLRSLTVRHANLIKSVDAGHLTKWIRRLSACSPLEEFKLVADSRSFPVISLDGLADHLGLKHGAALRILDMSQAFIGATALRDLCSRCTKLETLSIGTLAKLIPQLQEILSPCSCLHTVTILTPSTKASKVHIETASVSTLMEGLPCLWRFTLNDRHWKGSWTSTNTGVVFSVQQLPSTRGAASG